MKYYSIRTMLSHGDIQFQRGMLMEYCHNFTVINDYFNQTDTISDFYSLDFRKQSKVIGRIPVEPLVLKVKCEIEDQLLITEDYRDFSLEEIEKTIISSKPSDYYDCGGRIYVLASKFITLLERVGITNFKAYPVILHNGHSNQQWDHYFAVRFIGIADKKMISDQPFFVDKKSLVLYFNEETKLEIENLGIDNISFDWIQV